MLHDLTRRAPCPACGKPASWDAANPWRPFCSERCRLVDLGAWVGEEHRIPGDEQVPEHHEH